MNKKNRWKLYLSLAGVVILMITLIYTYSVTTALKEVIENNVEILTKAQEEISNMDSLNKDITTQLEIINRPHTLRLLVINGNDEYVDHRNISDKIINNPRKFKRLVKKMKKKGQPFASKFEGLEQYTYYLPPPQYNFLSYMPLFILIMLSAFIFMGYSGFNSARKSEQNKVWVGMARETAHQLGTPISGIIAWLENLKITNPTEDQLEIIYELENDIERLNLITDRFSKIGAVPDLNFHNLKNELMYNINYMSKRAPRRVKINFLNKSNDQADAKINKQLFDWVIENLLRNAIDATEGEGIINVVLNQDETNHIIDLSDNGKGIAPNQIKNVFKPGFTTKKRGWGLGLSLAKRIIENYHKGKIFVKQSKPYENTTFRILIPKK